MTREEAYDTVRRPGKFEGEAPYVPWYWDLYLDGGADEDDGGVLVFNVLPEDVELFPELCLQQQVRLMELENGFVVEVA